MYLLACYAAGFVGLLLTLFYVRPELSEAAYAKAIWIGTVTLFCTTALAALGTLRSRKAKLLSADMSPAVAGELSESLERERLIGEYASDMLFCVDSAGRIIAANSTSFRLWGIDSTFFLNRAVADICVLPDAADGLSRMHKAIADQANDQFDLKMQLPNGTLVDCRWDVEYSRTDGALYCVVADISERKLVERMRQQFMSMLGHDLRAPLASVQVALAAVGRDKALPDESRASVLNAGRSLDRVIALCSDLLDLQQAELGQLAVKQQLISVPELVEETMDEFAAQSKELNQTVKLALSPSFVHGDEQRLKQVVANLVSNAIKYAGADSTISVSTRVDAGRVRISVEDSGAGITEQQAKQLFQPYARLHPEQGPGTGLGLVLSKYIVEAHGGNIELARSDLGGLCVWFELAAAEG